MSVRIGKSGPVTIGASKKHTVQQFLSDTGYSFACNRWSSGECRNKLRSYVGVLRYEDGLKITDGHRYFSYMDELEEIPELDFSNLKSLYTGFSYDKSLKKLPNSLSNAPLSYSYSLYCAFWECRELKEIPDLNTVGNQVLYWAFRNCVKLKKGPNMDTSSVTDMTLAFDGCTSLEEIPHYDTSKVTTFDSSFANCEKLKDVSWFDFSSAKDTHGTFAQCTSLTTVPETIDLSNCKTCWGMFNACTSLKKLPSFVNTSSITNFGYVFNLCESLEELPYFDTSSGTNFARMVCCSYKLKEIPAYDMSNNATDFGWLFGRCWALEAVHCFGMNRSFSLEYSGKLQREALVEVLNNLADLTDKDTQTLGLGNTLLSRLTDDDKKIATDKNWTLK